MATSALLSDHSEESWPFDDWRPSRQQAYDILKEHEAAGAQDEHEDEDDDDSDDWNPAEQSAVTAAPGAAAGAQPPAGADVEEESDDDWAPQQQGAVDVKRSEKEALEALLRPPRVAPAPPKYETQREANAGGRMLHELKRPPTVQEVKAAIPKDIGAEIDQLEQPSYVDMTEDEAVEMVERGANVNFQGQHGRAPLHKAVEQAHPKLIRALCDRGGDPDIRDNYGETPLLLLAHAGPENKDVPKPRRSEAIEALLSCGANLHAVNPRGRGVLHLAAAENDHAAIETFIEGRADVNSQDLAGFTALMWAAGRNGSGTVKMLLDFEANLNMKALKGQTALTFALTNGCAGVAEMLEQKQMLLDQANSTKMALVATAEGELAVAVEVEPEAGEAQAPPAKIHLQVPRPEWVCKTDKPEKLDPYTGRRVYPSAKPDSRSNVYG